MCMVDFNVVSLVNRSRGRPDMQVGVLQVGKALARSSLGAFPDDVSRTLVIAEAEEARLAQPGFTRPFGEADLGDELGPCPVCAARDRSRIDEGRLGRLQAPQPNTEVAECRLGVAGPDLPGVTKGALLVVSDEQGTKVGPAATGIGVAADDEL